VDIERKPLVTPKAKKSRGRRGVDQQIPRMPADHARCDHEMGAAGIQDDQPAGAQARRQRRPTKEARLRIEMDIEDLAGIVE
jgi:hypothetical protein